MCRGKREKEIKKKRLRLLVGQKRKKKLKPSKSGLIVATDFGVEGRRGEERENPVQLALVLLFEKEER